MATRPLKIALASILACACPALADGQATIRLSQAKVRSVDGITVDINAGALRDGSTPRVAVVPAATPDAVDDPNDLAAISTPMAASRVRMTLPPGPPGDDEVRVYYIPRLATAYVVAARAPITVEAGTTGAALAHDLLAQSAAIGPVRFEALYKGRSVLVEAQFLRVMPQAEWLDAWLVAERRQPVAIMEMGTRGIGGGSIDALCVLSAGDDALQRMASLKPGDPVLVRGTPSTWESASPEQPFLLKNCGLAGG